MNILKIKKPKSLSGKFKFYPNIKQNIKKNIRDLNLKPLYKGDSFEKSWRQTIKKPKHTLILFCRYQGIPAVYKALVLNQPASEWGFQRNILIAKNLAKTLTFSSTEVLDYQIKSKNLKYLIHKYFAGRVYSIQEYNEDILNIIINNLEKWQKSQIPKILRSDGSSKIIGPDGKLYPQNFQLDLKWINFYLQELNGLFSNTKEIIEFLKNNSNLVDKNRKYLCHGDFTPVNIILNKKNRRSHFIDFEYTRVDHRAWDVANFYFISWENPEIQTEFVKKYLAKINNQEEFWQLFHYQVVFDMTMLAYYSLVEISNQFQKNPSRQQKLKILKYWQKCFWHCEKRLNQALNRPQDLLKIIDNNQSAHTKFTEKIMMESF